MRHRIWGILVVMVALLLPCASINSVQPIWVSSSYFKAGVVTFTYTSGSTNQNSTITYTSAMINTTLKVPTMGITDLNYQIVSGRVYLLIQVVKYTVTYLTFNVKVNDNSYLTTLKLTYMALDNLFKPAFSMNYNFPQLNKVGPNLTFYTQVNFTNSTGVTLDTTHENVLLPYLHYIDGTTRDGTVNINLIFALLNSSFYSVSITSKSDMTLKFAGFSRLIFDKTAIEALGSDYFNYGIISALNNNSSALATTIPPDIIPSNLFYGMHSFTISTSLAEINFISSYDISSGLIGYNALGNYVFQEMKFSYMHHKTRICPGDNPYYNISELLCYDECAPLWYGDNDTMSCQKCADGCASCPSSSACTACISGYYLNGSSCISYCRVENCVTCSGSSSCLSCQAGYSVGGNSFCEAFCGNNALDSSQECDDGNSVSGDGCSATCKRQADFSCYKQQINNTNTYSQCFYASNITFTRVWTRKYEGRNSLKLEFQLAQKIKQWETVNFTSILGIGQYTKKVMAVSQNTITSYQAGYKPSSNRFWVIVDYSNRSLQNVSLIISLSPYSGNYPAFTPPKNANFIPSPIELRIDINANNNQHANYYTSQDYRIYDFTLYFSYFVVALALLGVATSLIFRTGKVIAFQMIAVVQMVYFSLAFLDSMSPAFSGMLPLRYIAGILTFQDVQVYLQEGSSPNSMKGIYMFLNLINNFSWAALALGCLIGLGLLLGLIFFIYDFFANPVTLQNLKKTQKHKNGYLLHRVVFHFLGQLSLSFIFFFLPVFSIGLFFEFAFTGGKLSFWSHLQALGIGLAVVAYFIALLKSDKETNRFGQFISQFNCLGLFKRFKYSNFQMLQTVMISGLAIATIYADSRMSSAVCIILVSTIDMLLVAVIKPYRYGFVSCRKGDQNETEVKYQKIELYKVQCQPQPTVLRLEHPDVTQKLQLNDNQQQNAQNSETKMNTTAEQGQILSFSKLFLFNNNIRRIFNLATIILIQLIFIICQIYSADITRSYSSATIQNMLPLIIHLMLTVNAIYNYFMLVLQIVNRKKESLGRVDIELDSNSLQFSKPINTPTKKDKIKQEILVTNTSFINHTDLCQVSKDMYQVNKLILKSDTTASSIHKEKKPRMVKPGGRPVKQHRRNVANVYEISQFD